MKHLYDISQTDLHNLGDAEDEMMLALDADEKVPYLLGEVFLLKTQVRKISLICSNISFCAMMLVLISLLQHFLSIAGFAALMKLSLNFMSR
jgi:hypothetical protein